MEDPYLIHLIVRIVQKLQYIKFKHLLYKYLPTFNFLAKHLGSCQRSKKYYNNTYVVTLAKVFHL